MSETAPKQSFGMTIRAARQGYHAVPGIGFVRIRAGSGQPPHVVDVAPFDFVPVEKNQRGGQEFRVWWDDKESERMVAEAVKLHIHEPVTAPRVLYLDDDGNLMGEL